jgi:hypothetical protein
MTHFVIQHQFWAAVILYWIFSAAVSAMPEPDPKGNGGYAWLYRFVHTIAGNITTAFNGRIPGLKPLIPPVLLIPIVLAASSCAARYTVHPGTLNAGDSAAYDTLIVAQAAIDQARTQPIPAEEKDALNALIRSYNVARESWLTYRGAVATNMPSDAYLTQLNKNLLDLTTAIRALAGKGVKP